MPDNDYRWKKLQGLTIEQERLPKEECPACGEFKYTVHRYPLVARFPKEERGILGRAKRLFESPSRRESVVAYSKTDKCHNCGLSENGEWVEAITDRSHLEDLGERSTELLIPTYRCS